MHHRKFRLWAAFVAPSLILAAPGCGGAPSVTSSQSQATVKGTVTVNGKLANTGAVLFDGANSARPNLAPVRAEIGKDGSYEAKAYVGPNRVSLTGAELTKQSPIIAYEKLTFDVQSGENTYAIDVPAKK